MFGSFGQSLSSPFVSPSVFGQTNNPGTNPFAPNPLGGSNPFGLQTGGSMFGTSTGVFGQPSGAPAFGTSSSPAVVAASTSAFVSSSSPFDSNSVFGQKPAFGGFGSTPNQSSPFGSTSQQTQSTFGSNTFGASGQPAFCSSSTPAFGSSMPAFGAALTPAFGATSTPAFGSKPIPSFGNTGTAFGVSSTPAFSSTATPAFGVQTTTPTFGGPNFRQTGFGSQQGSRLKPYSVTQDVDGGKLLSMSAMHEYKDKSHEELRCEDHQRGDKGGALFSGLPTSGISSAPAQANPFGSTSTFGLPSVKPAQANPFGSRSTFGQPSANPAQASPFGSASTFGQPSANPAQANPFGSANIFGRPSANPAKSSPFGSASTFGQPSANPAQANPFGFASTVGQPAANPAQANPLGSTSTFGQPAANPFSSATSSNPFAPATRSFASSGIGISSPSPFGSTFSSSSSNLFSSTFSTASSFGAPSSTAFGSSSSSIFSGATSAFSSPSTFGSTAGSSSTFNYDVNIGNSLSSGLFQPLTPSMWQTPSPFGQPTGFQQTTPASSSTPSVGFGGGLFGSSVSISSMSTSYTVGFGQTTSSLSTAFQSSIPTLSSRAVSFSNFGQTQPAPSGGFGGSSNIFNQGTVGQCVATQTNVVMQPSTVTNPFGTLPSVPQMSVGNVGSAPSVQCGISSMPVSEKPVPVKMSSFLCPKHLSQKKIGLPARKSHPRPDGQKVPFFSDDETAVTAPKADALFIPSENPRSLVIHPIEQCPLRTNKEKQSMSKDSSANGNGKVSGELSSPIQDETSPKYYNESPTENGHAKEQGSAPPSTLSPSSSTTEKTNGVPHDRDNHAGEADFSHIRMAGPRAGETASVANEHGAGIEALMPKLRHADYYTEPQIRGLAAKERAEPGSCRRVEGFVVGRHGFGSIKFLGETDVRGIDLESIVEFNNREVIVYKEGSKRPPIGQGLNKPAEVTMLNVKCINKSTGVQYTKGPKVKMYKEMLIKKAEEQGAEFVSYDAVRGEWKFRVKHFNS